ncbi:phosphoribosylformylglycinamidine synthase subunit PurQ [Gemmatimonadota bacterium]
MASAIPRVIVLTGFGINCDYETEDAFNSAGAMAVRVHVNELIENPLLLADYQVLAVPGGFCFGDDLGSGKVLANKLKYRLGDALLEFLGADKLVIGICNGFQVLVHLGLLPGGSAAGLKQSATVTFNDSGKFEDRWVGMESESSSPCVFTRGMGWIELPVRHGEGKFFTTDESLLRRMNENGQIALRYTNPDRSRPARYPFNPNGSLEDVAGICDPTGKVFGLMPHPEAFTSRYHHPRWTREDIADPGQGLKFFQNAVEYFS